MIFWLLTALWLFLIVFFFLRDGKSGGRGGFDWDYAWVSTIGTVGLGGVVWAILAFPFLGAVAGANATAETTGSDTQKLTALATDSSVSGAFFLGSGYVNGYQTFAYITKGDDDGYRLDSARANASTVYESDETPYVEYSYWKSVPPWWASPFVLYSKYESVTYDFHVPEGSILNNYQIQP